MSDSSGSGEQSTLAAFADQDDPAPESDVEELAKRVDQLEDILEQTVSSVSAAVDRVEELAERQSAPDVDDPDSEQHPQTDVRGYQ